MQKEKIKDRLARLLENCNVPRSQMVAVYLVSKGVNFGKKPKWIPVSERLPEKDMDVLLYDTQSATTFLGEFCSKTTLFSAHWFADNETWDISEFTHWMPLPELPKGVENETAK